MFCLMHTGKCGYFCEKNVNKSCIFVFRTWRYCTLYSFIGKSQMILIKKRHIFFTISSQDLHNEKKQVLHNFCTQRKVFHKKLNLFRVVFLKF